MSYTVTPPSTATVRVNSAASLLASSTVAGATLALFPLRLTTLG